MTTPPIRSDWVGLTIDGRYTLLQWLGGSPLSGVFLTELQGPGSPKVAIKLIPADAEDVEARLSGWAAASTLSHRHLMRLFDNGRCYIDGSLTFFAVTEFAEEALSQIIPERPLTPAEVEKLLDPILHALSYLHARGFVHGHLKPSNIMVVNDCLKLSADGLSIATAQAAPLSVRGVYDAPEIADGTISPAADLWALGVTVVEALTQHPPDLDANGDPVVPESIPQPFAGIARECLRSHPVRRCTLRDVRARLKPSPPVPEPVAKNPVAKVAKAAKAARAKLPVKAFFIAAIVVLVAAAALLLRSYWAHPAQAVDPQPDPPPVATATPPESQTPETPTPPRASSTEAAVVTRVMPNVSQSARRTIHGKFQVAIRVSVDRRGNVASAAFDSHGPSKYFANLAIQAARRWKFQPPQDSGNPASTVWILRFRFTRDGTEVTPVKVSR